MYLGTNIMAMQAHRNLSYHQKTVAKALQRLSSGRRINSAADDAAGLAISEKMKGQIRGLKMASQNAQNAISLLQTAEGGLNEVHDMLGRMRELAVQSANGTYQEEPDRENLNKEYQALKEEINRIGSYTHYNGIRLLDGSAGGKQGEEGLALVGLEAGNLAFSGDFAGTGKLNIQMQEDGSALISFQAMTEEGTETITRLLENTGDPLEFEMRDGSKLTLTGLDLVRLQTGVATQLAFKGSDPVDFAKAISANGSTRLYFQVGANGTADQRIGVPFADTSTTNLGTLSWGRLLEDTDILNPDNAGAAIEAVKLATNQVSSRRGDIGAQINRLEYTIRNLDNTAQNLTEAESRIADADMAEEMMNYTKASILMQAAQAMMAQAMQLPYGILQLLQA